MIATRILPTLGFAPRADRLVERNVMNYRRTWLVLVSGFFEPLFYLLGIGFGIGALVGTVTGPDGHADPVQRLRGARPAGLVGDERGDLRLDVQHLLQAALRQDVRRDPVDAAGDQRHRRRRDHLGADPGTLYAIGFLAVMLVLGLVRSPWVILALPAAMLIGFAFAAVGMAATTWVRSWTDFDYIFVVTLPLFLFSSTFYPLSVYPEPLRTIVALTPLSRCIDLLRSLALGQISPVLLVDIAYLLVMGGIGLWVVSRRLDKLLLK